MRQPVSVALKSKRKARGYLRLADCLEDALPQFRGRRRRTGGGDVRQRQREKFVEMHDVRIVCHNWLWSCDKLCRRVIMPVRIRVFTVPSGKR